MHAAISETNRRRQIQMDYNREHGITPASIKKAVRDLVSITKDENKTNTADLLKKDAESMSRKELKNEIAKLSRKMNQAAAELNFEDAAVYRDELRKLRRALEEYDK